MFGCLVGWLVGCLFVTSIDSTHPCGMDGPCLKAAPTGEKALQLLRHERRDQIHVTVGGNRGVMTICHGNARVPRDI